MTIPADRGVVALTEGRVLDGPPGADLSAPELDDSGWMRCCIPCDLHEVLVAHGRLPDLDHGTNNGVAGWVEEREWWWRLDVPRGGILTCEGLDTYVTLYLDGVEIGSSYNMFLPFSVELAGPGLLALCFHRPLDRASSPVQMRKAQYSYGWDFAPRSPGLGPWRPITLGARVIPPGLRTVSLHPAIVEVSVQDGATVTLGRATRTGSGLLALGEVELWSPEHPALHQLRVDDELYDIGVRTVDLDRTDGAFRFVVNGTPLPIRGVNWVPTPADHEPLLRMAKDAGMNMVRIWGGGRYEDDAFYDTCDRLGLLVWQDFMFACGDYRDDDPAFVASVRAEARHQVRRLRRHPSVGLWCGNNEVELLAQLLDWDPCPARSLFYDVLPAAVEQYAPGTAYIPTSPVSVTNPADGDRHNWQVWHGLDETAPRGGTAWQPDGPALAPDSQAGRQFASEAHPSRYLEDRTRFASEYGLCSSMTWETLCRVTDPTDLALGSQSVQNRFRPGRLGPRNKLQLLMAATVGEPGDLREWVELSHLMQAEGDKAGVEHYRRQWPHCGGNLLWQLNDCWPAVSWSLVDVDGRPKPAYFTVQRASQPNLASFAPDNHDWLLWFTTDGGFTGELVVSSRTFDGTIRWERSVPIGLEALSSQPVARFNDIGEPSTCYLTVTGPGVRNRQLLADYAHLHRTQPNVTAAVVEHGVQLTTDSFAMHVDLGPSWSDRFFDLEPGETRFLKGSGPLEVRAR